MASAVFSPKRTTTLFLLFYCTLCAPFLFLLPLHVVASEEVVINEANPYREARFTIPDVVTTLNDTNFDDHVFPSRLHSTNSDLVRGPGSAQAWLILIYSPWCDLCKGMIPHFLNASLLLAQEESQTERHEGKGARRRHARMGLLDAYANLELRHRLRVLYYPTLLYTTGRPSHWEEYQGDHTTNGFYDFARALQRSVERGGFAEDLTSVARFHEAATEGGGRVAFYVFVPADSPGGQGNSDGSDWAAAIEGVVSLANTRFGVIFEREMAADWRAAGGAAYVEVVEMAKACKVAGKGNGPAGEVLVSVSDRFRRPRCYAGSWLDPPVTPNAPPQTSAQLKQYLVVNGFRAVEELSSSLLTTLETQKRSLLGLVFTDGGLHPNDTNYLPVLREIVQKGNAALDARNLTLEEELNTLRVVWAQTDGAIYDHWRTRYQVEAKEMPAFLIVDPLRARMFRVRTRVPELEAMKLQTPWEVGGVQQRMLEQFIEEVVAGKYYGEKLSLAATLAEWLTHVPGLEWVYSLVSYDDYGFLILLFSVGFLIFLLLIALVVEPLATQYLERKKKLKID
ncbi:unnamed protein product [Phytomonas sp. EM1]|nr:unnamed protein product [Phytomonas sp. EM1]|eukprot:CCW64855.1 unnamed protein product [Phytomonas sp. isolate EM1]